MKKAIYTFGLFSMLLVLTSFTTPSFVQPEFSSFSRTKDLGIILPSSDKKSDYIAKIDSAIYSANNEPGGGTPSYPRKVD